jgi:hypothetical protein
MTDKLKLCMFDVVLQSLVSLNMDRRQHVDVDYSSVHDLRNYATVRFDTGEGTGKTTWLHDVAGEGDVLICRIPLDLECDAQVFKPEQVFNAALGTLPSPSAIYIDDAGSYTDMELDTIYSRLCCYGVTFVLVG